MNERRAGRRRAALAGGSAAALTAAVVLAGPGTAAGAPADPTDIPGTVEDDGIFGFDIPTVEDLQVPRVEEFELPRAGDFELPALDDLGEQLPDELSQWAEDQGGFQVGAGEWLPEDLEQDLRELQGLPADERAEAVEEIRANALDGAYGPEVAEWIEQVEGLLAMLPEELRADLEGLPGLEEDQFRAELQRIHEAARAGEYGPMVQMWLGWFERSAERWAQDLRTGVPD